MNSPKIIKKCQKSSVVAEPYESKRSPVQDGCKTNISTIIRSESSTRKWKVSESIYPVMSEFDRFSLNILSENSFGNRSYGSFNETFEKNLQFNLQNSLATSSSCDSRRKKVSISAAPLIKPISSSVNINVEVIKDTQTLVEVHKEESNEDDDIDDVHLSFSSENDAECKSSGHVDLETQQFETKENVEPEEMSLELFTQGRLAKHHAKEKIANQLQLFENFAQPVDIDESQNSQTIPKSKNRVKTSPQPTFEKSNTLLSIESWQPSKLCDVSKQYILSQESSLISSPLDRNVLKSAVGLPGRTSLVQSNSLNEPITSQMTCSNDSLPKTENITKKPFFKSSFTERRIRELEKFNAPAEKVTVKKSSVTGPKNGKGKSKAKLPPKKPKEKKIKEPAKKNKRTIKECSKPIEDNFGTIDSTKDQVKKIIIEDYENDKFDYPIEKARCSQKDSDDDLFSFTPEIAPKRKRKTTKKVTTKPNRKSSSSNVYDVLSDLSSPSPLRLSHATDKPNKVSADGRLGDEVIRRRSSFNDAVSGFESDLDQLRILQQSLTYQFNQFKEMAKCRSYMSP